MPKITIGTDTVNFPDSGSDALWSPAVIQFAELTADQFLLISTAFDISPKVVKLSTNSSPSTFLIGASFNPASVRNFVLTYAIYRTTTLASPIQTSLTESGKLTGIFNTKTNSWMLQDEFFGDKKADGTAYHTFDIDSQNRIILYTEQMSGVQDTDLSTISFSAKTELVSV